MQELRTIVVVYGQSSPGRSFGNLREHSGYICQCEHFGCNIVYTWGLEPSDSKPLVSFAILLNTYGKRNTTRTIAKLVVKEGAVHGLKGTGEDNESGENRQHDFHGVLPALEAGTEGAS